MERSFHGASVRNKVTEAFDPPLITDKDRVPRSETGESYVKDWRPLRLGVVHFESGRGPLIVRAIGIPGKQAMDLRGVVLTLK